jgi:hypothetical protein
MVHGIAAAQSRPRYFTFTSDVAEDGYAPKQRDTRECGNVLSDLRREL